MKRLLPVIIFVLLVIFLAGRAFAPESVRLTNGEWPPFLSEHLPYYGLASRVVSEAFSQEGVKVKYGFFPWKRAFLEAKKGKWDGTLIWSWSEERAKYFYYSQEPVLILKDVFFYRRDHIFDWKDYSDLQGLRIGATLGYYYGEQFARAERQGKIYVDRAPSDLLNLKKLLKGRIDLFVCTFEVGYRLLSENFEKSQALLITNHPRPVRTVGYYLILSKKIKRNKELIRRFDQGFSRLKDMGKLELYEDEMRTRVSR